MPVHLLEAASQAKTLQDLVQIEAQILLGFPLSANVILTARLIISRIKSVVIAWLAVDLYHAFESSISIPVSVCFFLNLRGGLLLYCFSPTTREIGSLCYLRSCVRDNAHEMDIFGSRVRKFKV